MAPPMPPRFASAVLQLATLADWSTSYAPRITVSMRPPRAISNEVTLSKKDAPGFSATYWPAAL